MEHWENFSALHLATVAGFGVLWFGLCLIGRRLRGSPALEAWRRALGALVLFSWCFANGVQMLPSHFDAAVVLPLQICDIAGLVAALAIWQPGRLRSALLHFWGLGFSVQAILTPELQHRLADAEVVIVAETLVALGRVAHDFPRVAEIDVNPLVIRDGTGVALDGLIVLSDD